MTEVHRHASMAPLAVHHAVTRDTEFGGFHFPKGMAVSPNLVCPRPQIFL